MGCSVQGCTENGVVRDMCRKHYDAARYSHDKAGHLGIERRYTSTRSYCRRRGREFNISLEFFTKLLAQPCFYCGGPLNTTGCGMDRMDNSRGYTPENVLPCCGSCNLIRGHHLTVDETRGVIAFLQHYRAQPKANDIYSKCTAAALALVKNIEDLS